MSLKGKSKKEKKSEEFSKLNKELHEKAIKGDFAEYLRLEKLIKDFKWDD